MADEKKTQKPAKATSAKGKPAKAKSKGKADGKAKAKSAKSADTSPPTPPRFRKKYKETVAPELQKKFGYANTMQIPRLTKIVVNVGVGEAVANPKLLDAAVEELRKITGQQPAIARARKSIANFKLREGMPIGARVTLRGARMYEFYDRLVSVALPRIRDFRGVPTKSFDGRGNYTLGLKEQINFPEIDYDKIMELHGMDITFVTTANTDEESRELLALMRMPFRKN